MQLGKCKANTERKAFILELSKSIERGQLILLKLDKIMHKHSLCL